ncbi:PREDICTED: small membrane A-kinase anchor protein [Elephantulus edwardii]|uniref:small membrane A-kinase anchor protein n=1 Tax=Elephantulus edwardii TaxID=28737 RepID=UPI0003F0598E|nr:PREDICTED: small membrane A-kinase anchor protein [Elephantulus edwardii]
MGCMKSKQTFPFPPTFENEKRHPSEEAFMPETFLPKMPSPVIREETKIQPVTNPVILEYAQHLSEEILNDAMQQWACNNIKYSDIPYIESEGPDVVG